MSATFQAALAACRGVVLFRFVELQLDFTQSSFPCW